MNRTTNGTPPDAAAAPSAPFISVVIPTYNRAVMLEQALHSVIMQHRPADEIIVIDDGSTDNTASLVAGQFPQVRYLKQAHLGVSRARNTGIGMARGNWIALLDSDDTWHPDKLAHQSRLVQDQPECVLVHCDEIWIRHGRRVNQGKKHRKRGGYIFRHCLPLCAISPSAALIKKSLFGEIGLFDENLPACEDYDLWLRICSRYPVEYIDMPLLSKYGGHQDQLSKQFWGMDRFRIRALHKILTQNCLAQPDRQAAIEMLVHKCQIFIKGSEKRDRLDESACYRDLLMHYKMTTL